MKKKSFYKNEIIKTLYFNSPITLADIASNLGKSISLITKIILDIQEAGLVEEAGIAESSGGRKPILYRLNPDAGNTIVVAMDQFVSRIMVMNLAREQVVSPVLIDLDLAKEEFVADKLLVVLQQTVKDAETSRSKILGIGIAVPGFVDVVKGISYSFVPSPDKVMSLRDYLTKKLRVPVFIDNDSRAVALAESIFGAAKNTTNAMIVNVSWGIGLGIVANGKLYRGENGFAGEFSHIPIFNNGKICSCGKVGCLETETSLKIILHKVAEAIKAGKPTLLKKTIKSDDSLQTQFLKFVDAVERRDTLAMELVNEAAYNIGRGIAVLIHIFNPKKIVLSGRGAMVGDVWLPPIQQAINEHCIRRLAENIEIEVSDMGYQAEPIGAAALVVEHYCHALT